MIVDASGTPSRSISHHLLSAPRVALLGERSPCGSGATNPNPHQATVTYPEDIPAFCPPNKPNLTWNVRSIGHQTGSRTLKNPRHGADEQTPRSTGNES